MNTLLLSHLGLMTSTIWLLFMRLTKILIKQVSLDPGTVMPALITIILRSHAHASCLVLATSTTTKETLDSLPRWMLETLTLILPATLLILSSKTIAQDQQLELEQ